MEQVKQSGKARSIGASNFVRKDLEYILNGGTTDSPAVNQLEYHPCLPRENDGELYIPWMQSQGILVAASKCLSPVARCPDGPLVPVLKRLAAAYNTNEAAVMLRWFLQQGIVTVTTTSKPQRLKEYTAALTFEMSEEHVEEITSIGRSSWKRCWFSERYAAEYRS
jgi:diketogulonate reductase-like aldo/keto reductase